MFSFDFKAYIEAWASTSKIIIKTILPYFILAETLLYFDLLKYFAFIFEPISQALSLPPESALAIAVGMLFNLYGAIALGASLGLSVYEWTVLGLFLGVAHAMPVESAVLKKLGIGWRFSTLFRLSMAFIVLLPLQFIPKEILFDDPDRVQQILQPLTLTQGSDVFVFFYTTLINGLTLTLEIVFLVSIVLLVNQGIKGFRIVQSFDKHLSPVIALVSGALLGILYGSGILLKEAQNLSRKQILSICCFLMVAHAMIEDPLLFVLFGANLTVLITFRLALAIIVISLILLFYDPVKKRFSK
jgi:hypothetical protein